MSTLEKVQADAWHCASFGELDGLQALHGDGVALDAPDDSGFTPLAWAARNGHGECVDFLLGLGCKTESSCFGGMKPLHHAANKNLERVVKTLLKGKADANAVDDNLDTPVHYACARGVLNIVVALMGAGGDVTRPNSQGICPIHKSCIFGHLAVVRKLADSGIDINVADSAGDTPLHFAAKCGFVTVIKFLLEKGATSNATNAQGKTPADVAVNKSVQKLFADESA
jgi:ankyrin repeat protein